MEGAARPDARLVLHETIAVSYNYLLSATRHR